MPNKTITQVPITAKHIKRVVLDPLTVVGDVVAWGLAYDYEPAADTGASVTRKTRALTLTVAQQLSLQQFVNNHIVLDANAVEGT